MRPVVTRKLMWQLLAIGLAIGVLGALVAFEVPRVVGIVILCVGSVSC